ncbi:hypothetical protein K461DRAFT_322181 [Myriangium duriaei CBS 260.36]|uniref:Uncharacterized protein n=1 Tax=Myriangium duriaei CBS 260.36 TaxID=1168546 RepID=A0A9P4MLU5_9PEZI|nr:hypothetical protein K461DRAFT_322181 [Myriangium duriaei CBS 260.36]
MQFPMLALFGLHLLTHVRAYNVEFWGGSNCAGAPLGAFNGGTQDGCQNLAVGTAEGATIQRASDEDDGTIVAFYSSDDCDLGTAIAEGDNGCIAVDSFASQYKSFNVIPSAGQGKVRLAAKVMTENPYGYEHGKLAQYANTTYRWHQVGLNAWRGILPTDWDDHIHVKSYRSLDTRITVGSGNERVHSRDLSLADSTTLHERNFKYASCSYVKDCALKAFNSATHGFGYHVGTVAAAFFSAVRNEDHVRDVWGFLNSPFVIGISINQGAAALSGVVSALTSNRLAASSCSTQQSDADTMLSVLTALASSNPQRAVQGTLELPGGARGTISMEAVPNGQRGDGNTCGAPATDPSTGGK